MTKKDNSSGKPASLSVHCPGCGKPSQYESSNPFRPFCSPGCHSKDLISWATEEYKIPVTQADVSNNESGPDSELPREI